MDIFLYVFFGFFDVIAILALIFKIYRFPFFEYTKKLVIIGLTLSIVSYFNRCVIDIANYDMIVQFILYILFFRYLIKVRLYRAFSLATTGYLAFDGIQFTVYPLLMSSGIVTTNDAQELTGLGTYMIQSSTEIMCFLVAYLLYKFNLGFSFISVPPHDMYIKSKNNQTEKIIFISNIVAATVISSIMYWILNFHAHVYIVLPAVAVSLFLLIYFTNRRDFEQ
ncbi:hypothetical protein D3C73_597650 [compost metagenome]